VDILHVQDPHIALLVQRANQLGVVPTRAVLGNGTNEPYEFLRKITYLHHLAPAYLDEAKAAQCWRPTWTAIPNFIDTDLMRPGRAEDVRDELAIPRDALVVLAASAIKRQHKRVDYLLQEFAKLHRRRPDLPVWLVVAGARDLETEEVIRMGRQLLGERVRFLVSLPRDRMPKLYRAADLFVLCSLREMFGIVLLEASASCVPCLVHENAVLKWVIGPGGASLDLTAADALAQALEALLTDPDRRHQLGIWGHRYCHENFSRSRVLGQILGYYDFVLRHDQNQRVDYS
jgi:glycosyltransferase involved in cell wall biosynthesis